MGPECQVCPSACELALRCRQLISRLMRPGGIRGEVRKFDAAVQNGLGIALHPRGFGSLPFSCYEYAVRCPILTLETPLPDDLPSALWSAGNRMDDDSVRVRSASSRTRFDIQC
eukprot:460740-Rhodomonas_salina.1